MGRNHSCPLHCLFVLVVAGALPATGAETKSPIGVSPGGDRALTEVEQRCPTFSWGGDIDTARWDLVVYRFEEGEALPGLVSNDARPVLKVELPGSARSWTPPVGQCLQPGGRYAWAVRSAAVGSLGKGGESVWSEPRLFRVSAAPTIEEVRDAMAVLSAYLGGEEVEVKTRKGGSKEPVGRGVRTPTDSSDSGQNAAQPLSDDGVPTLGGTAAIRAVQSAVAGDASGFIGETSSLDGAGGLFANLAGGPDVVLDGSADTETDAALSQSGLDRASGGAETFDFSNSGAGDMTLTVDGVQVVTTATDADSLGGLSCADGELAKWNAGSTQWECNVDADTAYFAGNQLDLNAATFDVVEGSGSGLDADLLDGLDSTAFLPSGTDNWVDVSGDTMTGTLTLNPAAGDALSTNSDIDVGTGSIKKSGSLFLHRPGGTNTAVGLNALENNTTALSVTAVGEGALQTNTSGHYNTAVGSESLKTNVDGSENTAIGRNALRSNTADDNTALGSEALKSNTTGDRNVAVGWEALKFNTTAPWNTAVGAGALASNTTGHRNVAIGGVAMRSNSGGYRNVAIGIDTLQFNHNGNRNVAIGNETLRYSYDASDNTGVGNQVMRANYSGFDNAAFGARALTANSTGKSNVAVGARALVSNSTGSANCAIGLEALHNTTLGSGNVGVGLNALQSNVVGSWNVALGSYAGYDTNGSSNILLNTLGAAGESNVLRIGAATGTGTRELDTAYIQGIFGKTSAGGVGVYVNSDGLLGTTTSSRRFKEEISGLSDLSENLMALRPVQFRFTEENARGQNRPLEFGLIAEEVAEILPELVVYDDEGKPFTVRYHLLTPLLLNEIQRQEKSIAALSRRVKAIEGSPDDGP